MELVVVGLSHKTAPLELRERVALTPAETAKLFRGSNSTAFISERLLLSTCNRTELYAFADSPEFGRQYFVDLIREYRGVDLKQHEQALYCYSGAEMVTHLFRVASSVDSMVVGEVQILGQLHEAVDVGRKTGSSGPLLQRLADLAFRVGKRVRNETEVTAGAVSVAWTAVTIARKIFSDMAERTALLVGSGETAELAARHLRQQGIGRLLVTGRTPDNVGALAARLGAEPGPWEQMEQAMAEASIMLTATSSPGPLIGPEPVRRVVSGRGNRPLLILDIAVPRDVDPAVGRLANVFLYDIDALKGLVEQNLERREAEIPKVEAIIRHEREKFLRWYRALDAAPTIKDLRRRFESVRAGEVEKFKHKFCERDRRQLDALTRGLINKLLHEPTIRIRRFQLQDTGEDSSSRLDTVRRLFDLGATDGKADDKDDA